MQKPGPDLAYISVFGIVEFVSQPQHETSQPGWNL